MACTDAHWEPRITAFLCLKQFQRHPLLPSSSGDLWNLYGKVETSWRCFEDRAEPPSQGEEAYEHLSAWISVLINEGDDEAPRIKRLGGKIDINTYIKSTLSDPCCLGVAGVRRENPAFWRWIFLGRSRGSLQ